MLDKPSPCAGCSLYGKGRGFLRPSGPIDADLLFVAESAGAIEAIRGEGMVGDAGGMFNRLLNMKGIARNSVRIHNVISCQPPNNWLENAPWEEAAIRQCRANLEPVLAEGHKVVVPMGNVALRAVLGLEKARGVKIENFHGTVSRDPSNRFWVVPTFHPSYLQRKARNLIGTVAWDIGVAKRVAKDGFTRDEAQLIVDPTLEWFRAYADAYIAAANKDPWGVWLATDIETPDKQAKEDEDELDAEDRSTIILRINFSYSSDVGITVPWVGPYISIVEEMLATHGVKIFHNCPTPDQRVLKADLTWEQAGNLKVGDELISFDEEPDGERRTRRYKKGTVTHAGRDTQKVTAIHLSDGSVVKTTSNHPWLMKPNFGVQRRQFQWVKTNKLKVGYTIQKLFEPWFAKDDRDFGYLEGFFDGEGTYVVAPETNSFQVRAAQNVGDTLTNLTTVLNRNNFNHSIYETGVIYNEQCKVRSVRIAGRTADAARFLGSVRPKRLLNKFRVNHLGAVQTLRKHDVTITKIEDLGEQEIVTLSVDSKTYILEGYGAHNCHYDMPRLKFNQIQVNGPLWDSMDAWHALHTNLPKSLGFISPFFSNLGPWKHLASTNPGLYAAYDPVQTFRDMVGIAKELQSEGRWDIYFRHMYMMDAYVLQPASDVGTGANKQELLDLQKEIKEQSEEIHSELQPLIPDHIKPLHPKDGWAKPPNDDDKIIEESDESDLANEPLSVGSSDIFDDIPDANAQASWDHLLGSGDNALTSTQHQDPSTVGGLRDGIIARKLKRLIQVCITCGDGGVSKVHKCLVGDRNVQLLEREVTRYFRREPFNPASPVQMLAYFEYKGHKPGMNPKTRKPSVDKQVLERVAPKDPVIREIIKVKNLDKIESTYVTPTLNRIGVGDGRIHPSFGHKPNTLRTNSWEPNLQNIPNKEDNELGYRYRSTLEASPGCKMISIDFAGIEAVLTGWFAGDKDYMRLAYLGVHAYVTAQKVGESADLKWSDADLLEHFNMIKVKYKKEYKQNKKVVHTSNYLGGAAGIYRSQPEMFANVKEAQALQDFYFEVAPKIKQWQINTVNMAAKQKFLGGPGQHPFGYKFWFWDVLTYERVGVGQYTWLQKQGKMVSKMQDMHFAINLGPDAKPAVACMPQSSAGGEMYETSLRLFVPEEPNYIGDTYFGRTPLRALVHDEYWLEVENRYVDRVIASAYEEMTRPIPQMGGLVLGASVKVGKNLGLGLEDYKIGGLTGTLASDVSVGEEES